MSIKAPIERLDFQAGEVLAAHPPVWRHPNKQVVFDIACPPGVPVGGHLAYSRWAAMDLPPEVELGAIDRLVVAREGYFDYKSVLDGEPSVEWHVNFADP